MSDTTQNTARNQLEGLFLRVAKHYLRERGLTTTPNVDKLARAAINALPDSRDCIDENGLASTSDEDLRAGLDAMLRDLDERGIEYPDEFDIY